MIALIAAVARNGVIGKDGKIPWRLPEDMKRFKQRTMGHVLVMGRKTYESIGRPLPGRVMIALTRDPHWVPSTTGVFKTHSLDLAVAMGEGAISMATGDEDGRSRTIFICGGAEVYREALDRDVVDKVYLTKVHADFDGDAYFPLLGQDEWARRFVRVAEEHASTGEGLRYSFYDYDRRRRP